MNTTEAKDFAALIELVSSNVRAGETAISDITEGFNYLMEYDKEGLVKVPIFLRDDLRSVLKPLVEISDKLNQINKQLIDFVSPADEPN